MNILLILLFVLGCFLFTQIERKYIIPHLNWGFVIVFCLLLANRSMSVPDTDAYYAHFVTTTTTFDDFGDFYFETGFQIFVKMLKIISRGNFVLYLGLITLTNLLIINFSINLIGKLFRAEQEKNVLNFTLVDYNGFFRNPYFAILPLTLYIAFFGIYLNAIVLRVGITLSLIVLSSCFAIKEKKNFFDYLFIFFLIVLGYYFHSTSLIGILIVVLLSLRVKFEKKTYLIIWFLIGLVYFTNFSAWLGNSVFSFMLSLNELTILATKLSSYDGNVVQELQGVSMKFVFFWIMGLLLILENVKSEIYNKYLNVYLTGLVLFALFRSVLLIERVTDYFLLFSFVIFYLYLIVQKPHKFWLIYIFLIATQLVFVLRITK